MWLNPTPEEGWDHHYTNELIRELMGGRMFPLTLGGLEKAMKSLTRAGAR